MLKKFILMIAIICSLSAKSAFIANIEVADTKANGKAWDYAGGAPDILLYVDGKMVPFSKECKDKYRCEISFISKNEKWYIEVYDKDIKASDLIGKGECKLNSSCKIGQAVIKITK
jgi:hypothetical protein